MVPALELQSVDFLEDAQHGWAVGEGGTILTTVDGGQSWRPQASGTATSLSAVQFLADGQHGWAVGDGGTILTTPDGGQSWRQLENYARGPAPWTYLLWAGAFACLLAGARWLPPDTEQQPESVADRLASDRPLGPRDPDPLGYRRIAAGLSRFLRNEKTEPPLTIEITGQWGSGKSSLMNLLRADLERFDFRPVWFNAWHHQKEEHLFAALLAAVRDQAVPGWWSAPGLLFRARLLRRRTRANLAWTILILAVIGLSLGWTFVRWPQISPVLGDWVSDMWARITAGGETAGSETDRLDALIAGLKALSPVLGILPALLGLWVAVRNRLGSWQLSPAKLMASLGERVRVKELDAQLGFRHEFAAGFEEVCEALHPRTLVIIIDDLDRCRPEQVVETLEAVNFLVTAGPRYVILGVAPEQVMRCVGLGFKEIAAEMASPGAESNDGGRSWRREFARNYLEKLINVEVPVPSFASEDARKIVAGTDAPPSGASPGTSVRAWLAGIVCAGLFAGALFAGANLDGWLRPPPPAQPSGEVAAPGPIGQSNPPPVVTPKPIEPATTPEAGRASSARARKPSRPRGAGKCPCSGWSSWAALFF